MTPTPNLSNKTQFTLSAEEFDFDRYSDNVVQSAALPWVQLITPKDKKLPFGLFLKRDCAEAVNFQSTEDWQPFTATFESGETEVEDEGYLTQILRLCVIRQTVLEGYGKNQWGKFEWLGPMYDHVAFGQRVKSEPFSGVGTIPNPEEALNSLRFGHDGSVFVSFSFNCWVGDRVMQYYCEAFDETANWLTDNLLSLQTVEITGTRTNGMVRVERIEVVTPTESATPTEFEDY
jgi:hypothetical protein